MDTAEIGVTFGGVALVAFILWFFFGSRTATQPRMSRRDDRRADAEIRGADSPGPS